jgi:hypothetical protein
LTRQEFTAWCDKSTQCALHSRDVPALYADLVSRAERGELRYPGDPNATLPRIALSQLVENQFYAPSWVQLGQLMAALDTGTQRPGLLSAPADKAPAADLTPSEVPAFCQDYLLPIRSYRQYADLLRRSARQALDMRFSFGALAPTMACLGTPPPIPNPQHRLHVTGSSTLRLVNSVHDPVAGYRWAVNKARQLGDRGRLLTYEGWGHTAYGRGDCTTGVVDAYLISRKLPAPGKRCSPYHPPKND